jgi:hypothetical protein
LGILLSIGLNKKYDLLNAITENVMQRSAKNLKVLGPGPTWSENDGPFLPKYGPWENK